jgi:protocatechuate 3,4-dioxygenase alpha subunit
VSARPARLIPTPTQTVGPFFHFCLADDPSLGRMAVHGTPGDRVRIRVTVVDADGLAVPDALVELYQTDASGRYADPRDGRVAFSGFGRMPTGEDGACLFETIRPARPHDQAGGPHAAHVNVCLLARGLLSHLFTRLYFAGDPDLGADALLAAVPEARRDTLVARPRDGDPGLWTFDIRLQGDRETVFFVP